MKATTNGQDRVRTCALGNLFGRLTVAVLAIAMLMGFGTGSAWAQTAGDGAITGTVKDATGAVVPGATVTAKNIETGVETTRTTDGAGIYQVSPIIVGTYNVTVVAKGFGTLTQQNISINENQTFGFNPVLSVGATETAVTVTEAPPALDTANAVLGGTISASEFADLPVMVTGQQQRDITSFSNYLPGAQTGSRSSLFSGTANRVQEVYLDGIPLTTINQIGDNRPIFNVVPFEGIGEVGALTSGQSVEYQGAGSVNYSMKSGGNKYHGTVADFIRNTIFDTWGFSAPAATVSALVNGVITKVPAGKPIDHQNELAASFGGPVTIPHLFNGHDKLFFFAAYDKLHSRAAPAYASASIPTTLMQSGNFSELLTANGGPGYAIYDPTTLASCTAHNTGNVPCRYQYGYGPGAVPGVPVLTGAPVNVIPSSEISPISQMMQSYLPTPTVSGIQNNFLGGIPSGYDNWLYSFRFDYTLSPRQTLSGTVTGGNRHAVPYTGTAQVLPLPYLGTTASTVAGHWVDLSHTYTFTSHLVNQLKGGFSNFGGPPIQNITQNTQYAATKQGISFPGVPANGQAVTEFPTSVFNGSNAQTEWGEGASGATDTAVVETYTVVDNLSWIKGKHAMTFGAQMQRIDDNTANYDGPTSTLTLNWGTAETAAVVGNTNTSNTGYAYASYLLGAVGSTGITLQPFSVLGGRYRPFAPYFEDDYKITSKLTLNLGIRWDYIPTYQETLSRWSFLNPNLVNPVTGNMGALQFAGNWGGSGISCGCASPAQNYMKNWGPHVGFAFAADDKTVFRGAFSVLYSHGGGTGGAGGAATGTSQLGFTSSPSYNDVPNGANAAPAFYLNTSSAFTAAGMSNATFGGPGYSVPAITAPGAISQTLNVGNTVNSSGAFVTASGAPGFADPYISGRAPEFEFFNFGMQREVTSAITVMINYAGSQSHFISGGSRGLQSGTINPVYWALGSQLFLPATPANLAAANVTAASNNLPLIASPYAGFTAAASNATGQSKATIQQALTWMPQFSGTTDTWGGQTANANYNSFQLSVAHRQSHGLTLNINYTYSHNIDDAGTQRSGWAIPANRNLGGVYIPINRADRSLSANSVPQQLSIFGTYKLPFGKGSMGGKNLIVRAIAGGWTLSSISTYNSGTPLLVTASSCSSTYQPGAQNGTTGTCMPDINPNFTAKTIRQNGSWGKGITAKTLGVVPTSGGISYANGYIGNATLGDGANSAGAAAPCGQSTTPFCNPGQYMIGTAPRSAAFGLRNPSTYNVNAAVQRSFDVFTERVKFIFRVDCQNLTNHVTFGGINASVDSAAFGTVSSATSNTGSRDFQFSGRVSF